jgi:6-phosphogluconolactonase (cycloisomerase 2 family)
MRAGRVRNTNMSRNHSLSVFGMLLFALVLALAISGCGGGGGGGSTPIVPGGPGAPSNLSYAQTQALYVRGQAIAANAASVTGTVETWSIDPSLPAGLGLDPLNGTISGVPSAVSPLRTYTVAAANVDGSASTQIELGVVLAHTFALGSNIQDDTLSLFVIDPKSGIPRQWCYVKTAPGESFPRSLVAHPSGSPIYVANRDTENVSIYDLDVSDGFLAARAPVSAGLQPGGILVDGAGSAAFVTLSGSGYVQAYRIDPADKGLLPAGPAVFSGAGAESLAIDAAGRYLYVSNAAAGTVRTFAIHPQSKQLTPQGNDAVCGASPRSLAWSKDQRFLYVANSGGDTLSIVAVDPQSGQTGAVSEFQVGVLPTDIAVDPFGRYLYVTLAGANVLETFSIDAATGALSPTGVPMLTGLLPSRLCIDSVGRRLYVVDTASWETAVFVLDKLTGQPTGRESCRTRGQPLALTLIAPVDSHEVMSQFAYVTNRDSNSLSMYKSVSGLGKLSGIGPDLPTGLEPTGLVTDPWSRYLFAINTGAATLTSYDIDQATGELIEIGAPLATGSYPRRIAVDLSGRFLYVSNTDSNDLSLFGLDVASGSPTALGTYSLGRQPSALALEPTGRFLYTANEGVNGISVLNIDAQSGVLTPTAPEFATAEVPSALEVHPTGRYLYATFRSSGEVHHYEINSQTGELSQLSSVHSGSQPTSMTIDPRGRWGFVTNYDATGTGDLSIFEIDSTSGTPTLVGTQVAGLHPVDAVVGPSGKYLFVANQGSDNVTVFAIQIGNGSLTLDDTIATGVSPDSIVVTGTFGD